MKPLNVSQEKYERFYIPLILIIGCLFLNLFYVLVSYLMTIAGPEISLLNKVLYLDWMAASNSMETASSTFTAMIFMGVIILEVFTNRYFPVVKYFFYNKQCLFIFTYSVSVTIFSYFSTFSHNILPYAPFLTFILLAFQNILLGLYFVFYIVTWISPSYTVEIIESDIKKLIHFSIHFDNKKTKKKDFFIKVKKEIFQYLSYIYTATEDKDRMVVNKAIFTISNILRYYLDHKREIHENFFQLSNREKDDKDLANLMKLVDIEKERLIIEAKSFALLNDIFNLLISKGKQGPDQICSVLDEYAEYLIRKREFNISIIKMINLTYMKFIDYCLEYKEEVMAVRVLDRMYHLSRKFIVTKFLLPEEMVPAEDVYQSIRDLAQQMKNYTILFYKRNLTDVLEKVADILFHFLKDIVVKNDDNMNSLEEDLLSVFLQVDIRPDPSDGENMSLLNVRVSQALLGSLYEECLPKNKQNYEKYLRTINKINLIVKDMQEEELIRIKAIKQLTLIKSKFHPEFSQMAVTRFFMRFKIHTLVLSNDKRFDHLNIDTIFIQRTESIRESVISLSMKKFHVMIIDDVPNLVSIQELIDLLINYVPFDVKPFIFIEFGTKEMKENLYKFTTLKIPFNIKYFIDKNHLDEDNLADQIHKIVYRNFPPAEKLRANLFRFKEIFN